jgi:hypothetical protein
MVSCCRPAASGHEAVLWCHLYGMRRDREVELDVPCRLLFGCAVQLMPCRVLVSQLQVAALAAGSLFVDGQRPTYVTRQLVGRPGRILGGAMLMACRWRCPSSKGWAPAAWPALLQTAGA